MIAKGPVKDFLKVFGQPERQSVCECDRASPTQSSLGRALQLFNGKFVHDKLAHPNNRIRQLLGKTKEEDIVSELYLSALCRFPTATELKPSVEHLKNTKDKGVAVEDLTWVVLNSTEFLFNH